MRKKDMREGMIVTVNGEHGQYKVVSLQGYFQHTRHYSNENMRGCETSYRKGTLGCQYYLLEWIGEGANGGQQFSHIRSIQPAALMNKGG